MMHIKILNTFIVNLILGEQLDNSLYFTEHQGRMEHCFMDNCILIYLHNVFLFNIWISKIATLVGWQTRSS